MGQQVKVRAGKPDNLNSIPWAYMVEQDNPQKLSLTSTHTHTQMLKNINKKIK